MRRLGVVRISLALVLALGGAACDESDGIVGGSGDGGSKDAMGAADGGDAKVLASEGGVDVVAADAKGDTAVADAGSPDGAVNDTRTPDVAPDAGVVVDSAVDVKPVDAATPDTAMPDAATPDTATPDTATPDTAEPDTATPDTATPDTATPDTAPSLNPCDKCPKLLAAASQCIPMGMCTIRKSATNPNVCFANGVKSLGTYSFEASGFSTSNRYTKPDGTTHCYTVATSGPLQGGIRTFKWTDPAGNELATGKLDQTTSDFRITCEGQEFDVKGLDCPGYKEPSSSLCMDGACQ